MEPEKKSNGALVGLIIIILILVIGGIYFWQKSKDTVGNSTTPQSQTANVVNEDSAELNKLEAEINTTSTNTEVDATTIQ